MTHPTIVHARPPRRIKPRVRAPVVVDKRRPPEHDPAECVAAAERLWRELVRRVEEGEEDRDERAG